MAKTPPTPIPSSSTSTARDLSDAEYAELDELLTATPEPLEPLDAVMLDGYLCGVLVQPRLIDADEWMPTVFDFDGRPLPDDVDPVWHGRCVELILRRHGALNRALVEDGWFDPLILEVDNSAAADAVAAGDVVADEAADPFAGLGEISQSLMPWVAGFQHATECFPDLLERPEDDVALAMARLFRHLPTQTDEEREVVATLDREFPLQTLDDAIEELVVTVADLADLTRDERYRVETVQRASPKLGRNDPCHCGSGKKFKHCHGA
ncbi:UPF0149 family protein [Piscinibacter sakaiensis]|uniref:UPF0149 family protein n=1 Tax=Piscinibacter sakaiensis TaxID=1547922 RepID=UPI003AAEC9BD